MRLHIFDGNSWYPPIMHNFFSYLTFSEKTKGSPRFFSAPWDKNFLMENCENLLLSIKFFGYPKCSEAFKVSTRIFSRLWGKKFPTEKRDTLLRCIKFLGNSKISETLKGSPKNSSALWEEKLRRRNVIPLLLSTINLHSRNFLRNRQVPHEFFWHCETKNFRLKNAIPFLLSIFIFQTRTQRGSTTQFFGATRLKKLRRKLVTTSFYAKLFSDTPNFLNHWRVPRKNFRHCERKKSRRKNVIPLLLSIIFFHTRNFLENWSVRVRFVLILSDKVTSTKLWFPNIQNTFDSRTFLKHKGSPNENFPHFETKNCQWKNVIPKNIRRIFLETPFFRKTERFPTNFSGTVRPKTFGGRSWNPPTVHQNFRYPNFSERLKGSSKNLSTLWDEKLPAKNVTPSFYAYFFSG